MTPIFLSRRRRGSSRFTVWKLALLFLGAGTWLAGVMMENFQVTAAAILIILIALVLSLVERRGEEGEGEEEEDEEEPLSS